MAEHSGTELTWILGPSLPHSATLKVLASPSRTTQASYKCERQSSGFLDSIVHAIGQAGLRLT